MELKDRLTELIEPVVGDLGFELVALEFLPRGRGATLRVFIDSVSGVDLDSCEKVSRELAAALDVEDPIPYAYRLEISSPGLDRPLAKPEHFARFVGEKVKVVTVAPINGQRRFRGVLEGMEGDSVMVNTGSERLALPLSEIDEARLVPDFDREFKGS